MLTPDPRHISIRDSSLESTKELYDFIRPPNPLVPLHLIIDKRPRSHLKLA